MKPRSSPRNPEHLVELHIEELVVNGLPLSRNQGPELRAAVETELARLLTEQGPSRATAGTTPHLSAGSIQLTAGTGPVHLGQQVAQAIYGGLKPIRVPPGQTNSSAGASG